MLPAAGRPRISAITLRPSHREESHPFCRPSNVVGWDWAGVENLLEDEAVAVGGSNHSHATADLYDAIAAGDYPEWKLLIQVPCPARDVLLLMQALLPGCDDSCPACKLMLCRQRSCAGCDSSSG